MTVSDFTYEQAKNLIATPKVILESDGKTVCKLKCVECGSGMRENIILQSEDEEFMFVWTINRSSKELIKLSLHVLEKDTHIGIFRVDYVSNESIHHNPEVATVDLPDELKPFIGLDIVGSHAHFNVAGYKTLQWAVPLNNMDFEIKSIVNKDNVIDAASAILCFARYINIKTPITAQQSII